VSQNISCKENSQPFLAAIVFGEKLEKKRNKKHLAPKKPTKFRERMNVNIMNLLNDKLEAVPAKN